MIHMTSLSARRKHVVADGGSATLCQKEVSEAWRSAHETGKRLCQNCSYEGWRAFYQSYGGREPSQLPDFSETLRIFGTPLDPSTRAWLGLSS